MSGTVLIGCPTCGRRYRYDTGRFGSRGIRIRCRTCEAVMRVDIPPGLQAGAGEAGVMQQPAPPVDFIPASPLPQVASENVPAEEREQQGREEPQPAPVVAPASSPPHTVHDTAMPKALVAERESELRELLVSSLQAEGYEVQSVDDGLAVRRSLASWRPRLVVLNVFLPNLLGVTLCSEIKRHPQLQGTRVLLVGSLYRRDRFMRHPDDLYGADGFLDGNAQPHEIRRDLAAFTVAKDSPAAAAEDHAGDDDENELARLARIVVGDIILYNPDTAEREMAAGRFLQAFAQEILEGEGLAAERFSHLQGHAEIYRETVKDAVTRHCEAAGMPTGVCR